MLDEAETDVLAFMSFPKAHRTQIHSTNPLERLNAEIKRRTNVVGIFPTRQPSLALFKPSQDSRLVYHGWGHDPRLRGV
jgi:putative transposase